MWKIDTPPNSWKDSNVNPKVKITKGKGVGAHFLIRRTFGVRRVFWSSMMRIRKSDKRVNYSY
jgi:hypothetical protein